MKNTIKLLILIYLLIQTTYSYANGFYPPSLSKSNISNVLLEKNIAEIVWQEDVLYEESGVKVSKVYPNPASEFAYIDYQINESIKAKVTIRNLLGRVMGEYELSKQDSQIKINTSEFESGVYFYTLSLGGKSVKAKKLIVEHK